MADPSVPDTSREAVEKLATPLLDLLDRAMRWDRSLNIGEPYVPLSVVRALLDEKEALIEERNAMAKYLGFPPLGKDPV